MSGGQSWANVSANRSGRAPKVPLSGAKSRNGGGVSAPNVDSDSPGTLYAKLATHRRAETVARARDLGLLAPHAFRS
jgi:hypothetical protein